ncbi:MAG: tRNA (guanosine(37)-N1)-methyltransferase TrmD [Myxococcota bacterium]
MRIDVVSLFPEMFGSFLRAGLLGRALEQGKVEVHFRNPRDHTKDKHRSVDDTPYGGGSGMVLAAPPIVEALRAVSGRGKRLLLTPQGQPFRQTHAVALSKEPHLVLVCGRYEGFDERVREEVDVELSLGDFVLLGGEVAAMAVIEATTRLLPGVIGNPSSVTEESHVEGLLEYPQYTRPQEFEGRSVPEILRSGDHQKIADWRRGQALLRTRSRRPDLFATLALSSRDQALLQAAEANGEQEP